ncbi:MAG: hypothetical protein RLZ98_1695 [Pseudomonadota bacterium]|jgi:acetyltransferase
MKSQEVNFRSPATVLAPRSIAIVGASERAAWPRQIYTNIREAGYEGKVHLINPRQKEVFGKACVPSLLEIKEPVDHALIIVPAAAVPGVLEDAVTAGIKSATVYSAGLGDGDAPESKERGTWLKQFAAENDIRLAGPNCMGGFSYRERLHAYPNTELTAYPAGSIGCVFQSGGTLQFFMKTGADRGLRYSYGYSTGNEIDLELADFVNFLVDDPETRQIVLFIEGIRRPNEFMVAAGRALEAGKPILAIKTGMTLKSQQAAQSHTGAIGGDYAAFLAMCERHGIIRCENLDDLLETSLAFQAGRLPKGPKIGFVTTSGGTVDLLYDYAETENAEFTDFSPDTIARLTPLMQEGIKPKNPLDAGIPTTVPAAAEWCRIVLDDPGVDMLAYASQLSRKKDATLDFSPLSQLLEYSDKPVLAFSRMIYQMGPGAVEQQERIGFPFLQGLQPTLRAMNALWAFAQRKGQTPARPGPVPASDLGPDGLAVALGKHGIRTPQSALARDAHEAVEQATRIGFPVVLKIESKDILHKTEAGGVKLNLRNALDVENAVADLTASAKAAYPDAKVDGYLVQEQVAGIEAIVGLHTDPLYGPMLVIGAGGILVELVKDVQLAMLPVSEADIDAMLSKLKLSKLLDGYRGQPPADRAALVAAVKGLSDLYLANRQRIRDIEINPLIVKENGKGAVAVDVRVLWND